MPKKLLLKYKPRQVLTAGWDALLTIYKINQSGGRVQRCRANKDVGSSWSTGLKHSLTKSRDRHVTCLPNVAAVACGRSDVVQTKL